MVVEDKRWLSNEVVIGVIGVFFSERCWMEIVQLGDGFLQGLYMDGGDGVFNFFLFKEWLLLFVGVIFGSILSEKKVGYFGSNDVDVRFDVGVLVMGNGDMFQNFEMREQMVECGNEKMMEEVEVYKDSLSCKCWVFIVYFLIWFIFDFLIRWLGCML